MTMVCTQQLRWKRTLVPYPGIVRDGTPKLQQLWEAEIGCGEVIKYEWRDVPVADHDAKDELFPSDFQGNDNANENR